MGKGPHGGAFANLAGRIKRIGITELNLESGGLRSRMEVKALVIVQPCSSVGRLIHKSVHWVFESKRPLRITHNFLPPSSIGSSAI